MARHSVGDGQDVFRAVIVHSKMVENPAYDAAKGWDQLEPRYIPDPSGATYETHYGPYGTVGAARGQATRESRDWRGPLRGVVGTRVEKADVVWTEVA